jgi:hypothetical protein
MREHLGAHSVSIERAAGSLTARIRQVGDELRSRPNEASLERQFSEAMRDRRLGTRLKLRRTPVECGRHQVIAPIKQPTDAETLRDDSVERTCPDDDAIASELPPQVIKWMSRALRRRRLSALLIGASWLVSIVVTVTSIAGAAWILCP